MISSSRLSRWLLLAVVVVGACWFASVEALPGELRLAQTYWEIEAARRDANYAQALGYAGTFKEAPGLHPGASRFLATRIELAARELAAYVELSPQKQKALANADCAMDSVRALHAAGAGANAVEAAARCLKTRSEYLPPEHPDILRSRYWLARSYDAAGRIDEATELYRDCSASAVKVWGESSREAVDTRLRLASIALPHGQFDTEDTTLAEILAILSNASGVPNGDEFIDRAVEAMDDRAKRYVLDGYGRDALRVLAAKLKVLESRPEVARDYRIERARRQVARQRKVLSLAKPVQDSLQADARARDSLSADDLPGSLSRLEQCAQFISRHLGSSDYELAEIYRSMGAIQWQLGNAQAADSLYECAQDVLATAVGTGHPLYADCLMERGHLRFYQDQYADARALYAEALPIYTDSCGLVSSQVAECQRRLGDIDYKTAEYTSAMNLMAQSLISSIALYGPIHPEVAENCYSLGWFAVRSGDVSGAVMYAQRVIRQNELMGRDNSQARMLLAQSLQQGGDFFGAEAQLRHTLSEAIENHGPDDASVGQTLGIIAEVQYDRGDFVGGEESTRRAIRILSNALGETSPWVAINVNNLANMALKQGRFAEADSLFRVSLEMSRDTYGEVHPDVAKAHLGFGYLLKTVGKLDEAETHVQAALDIYVSLAGTQHPIVALTQSNLGRVLQARGRYTEAESLYAESLATRRRLLRRDNKYVAQSLQNLARMRQMRGDYAGAESLMVEAVRCYEMARRRAGVGLTRATFQKSTYDELAKNRLLNGDRAGAWLAMEHHLSRALLDLLQTSEKRPLTQHETVYEDSLRTVLTGAGSKLEGIRLTAVSSTDDVIEDKLHAAEVEYNETLSAWEEFQREITSKYPLAEGQPARLGDVQRALPGDGAIVGWLDAEEGDTTRTSWCYVIRKWGPVEWKPLNRREDAMLVSGEERRLLLRDALSNPSVPASAVNAQAKHLWNERLAPVDSLLAGVGRLVVIPSGVMLGVPVEAMVDGNGASLVDRFTVSYAPSATVFSWLSSRSGSRGEPDGKRALLVGDPDYVEEPMVASTGRARQASVERDESVFRSVLASNRDAIAKLPQLPGTRVEVETISPLFEDPVVLLGDEASERRLLEMASLGELAQFDYIHLATHALIDQERPERSAIILSQHDTHDDRQDDVRSADGVLRAKDVVSSWQIDADLVVLSACETGLGRELGGEGYVGFSHAFLQAGARALVVSLWKVDDRATSLFMGRFYENLTGRNGEAFSNAASALKEAKQWLMNYRDDAGEAPYNHPYFWSAFVLVGAQS